MYISRRMKQNRYEACNELYGNSTNAEFWQYDARLGRRWNLDPVPQVSISDYACFGNNPIIFSDLIGNRPGGPGNPPKSGIKFDFGFSLSVADGIRFGVYAPVGTWSGIHPNGVSSNLRYSFSLSTHLIIGNLYSNMEHEKTWGQRLVGIGLRLDNFYGYFSEDWLSWLSAGKILSDGGDSFHSSQFGLSFDLGNNNKLSYIHQDFTGYTIAHEEDIEGEKGYKNTDLPGFRKTGPTEAPIPEDIKFALQTPYHKSFNSGTDMLKFSMPTSYSYLVDSVSFIIGFQGGLNMYPQRAVHYLLDYHQIHSARDTSPYMGVQFQK